MTNASDRLASRSARPAPGALAACRDERGASILLALFYFLVCAVVGAVVLTAATVTTGQLVALEKSQQAYYSVTSAAELLRDNIVGGTCTASGAGDSRTWVCKLPSYQTSLEDWLKQMVSRASEEGSGGTAAVSAFNMGLSGGSEAVEKSVLDVHVTATMQPDYSLHFTLRPKDYSEAVGDYRITLDIPAALLHGVDENTVDRITWERAIIGKSLAAEGGAGA